MKKAEEMARMAAEKYGARFVPLHDILMEKAVKEGYEKITTDGTHLTTGGAAVIAEKWLAVTANWLDKQGEIS
jgi:lysophospholipase L1-like esterase